VTTESSEPPFDEDAFISYAHLDNVELVEGRKGWVANLHRALEVRVGQLLGKTPHIWRDPKLSGNDLFAETLVERLRRVAVLIAVVSPRYLKSEWTIRELTEFWNAAEAQGKIRVRDKARVFKVLKTPVPLDRTPPQLRALLGYEFFKIDPETGKIRELDEVFGPDAQRDFWIKLDDLAHDICALLETLEAGETGMAAAAAPAALGQNSDAVFLALTTSELREQREALARDLQQHGYTILPDRILPLVSGELETAIRRDLARCRMSIHLIGRSYSLVPEGGVDSLIEIQHELATARSQAGRFSRLLWMPEGLQVTDERQRAVIEKLRLDPRLGGSADFLQTYFEDLRTSIHTWLTAERTPAAPPHEAPASAVPRLYLVADQRDAAGLAPWADALFDEKLEIIQPVFEGDEAEIRDYHEENLASCDGVLIFYGAGNELWLRRKLRELQKSPGYGRTKPPAIVGICLIPPRTPEKDRFRTHEAVVIPQWEGYVPGPLRPFIEKLKAGPSV
jgi:hypothetical protein